MNSAKLSYIGRLQHRILELQNRCRELERCSLTDPLTGLFNRRALDRALVQEHARGLRSGLNWGVVMVDIDHFKRFNDLAGHAAGDEVLRLVSSRLRRLTRRADTVGRWGGEEFMFIIGCMPSETLEAILTFGERVRAAIEEIETGVLDPPVLQRVTASVGAAVWWPGLEPDAVVERADAALYNAKENGRNACRIWGTR